MEKWLSSSYLFAPWWELWYILIHWTMTTTTTSKPLRHQRIHAPKLPKLPLQADLNTSMYVLNRYCRSMVCCYDHESVMEKTRGWEEDELGWDTDSIKCQSNSQVFWQQLLSDMIPAWVNLEETMSVKSCHEIQEDNELTRQDQQQWYCECVDEQQQVALWLCVRSDEECVIRSQRGM